METIRVPKPAREAFHKNRRVSDLLLSQVEHFQHVVERKGLKIDPEVARDVHTEGGAARFIAAVTQSLHRSAARKGKVVAMDSGRGAVTKGAGGTVRSIAAKAETSKKSKPAGGTASKTKKAAKNTAAKKTAKKAAKKTAKKAGAVARGGAKAKRKTRAK
jgi:hypothetical protein